MLVRHRWRQLTFYLFRLSWTSCSAQQAINGHFSVAMTLCLMNLVNSVSMRKWRIRENLEHFIVVLYPGNPSLKRK